MFLFARNEAANQWLEEHPGVLGSGAIVLGLILVGLGLSALITGQARSKRGHELKGGNARLLGVVWLIFGGVCMLFGAYKIITGVL